MQDAIFAWVGKVIAELWPFDFARLQSGVDFRKLNSRSVCKKFVQYILFLQFSPESLDTLH